jgi:cytochrome c5
VKQVKLMTFAGLLMIQTLATYALSPEDQAIAGRINPVGEVCIEGQTCLESVTPAISSPETAVPEAPAPETASPETVATGAPSPETAVAVAGSISKSDVVDGNAAGMIVETYGKTCAICHAAGLANAPKFGFSEDWAARIAKGRDVLYQSSINGLPPAMPAKGMCFSCSDDDLKALVDYMLENSQ